MILSSDLLLRVTVENFCFENGSAFGELIDGREYCDTTFDSVISHHYLYLHSEP